MKENNSSIHKEVRSQFRQVLKEIDELEQTETPSFSQYVTLIAIVAVVGWFTMPYLANDLEKSMEASTTVVSTSGRF